MLLLYMIYNSCVKIAGEMHFNLGIYRHQYKICRDVLGTCVYRLCQYKIVQFNVL